MSVPKSAPIPRLVAMKWWLFRLLERLTDALQGKRTAPVARSQARSGGKSALWVFVSTIGELNAIQPLLVELVARLSTLQLVLITDRAVYRDSYLARYPQAVVYQFGGRTDEAVQLAADYPPRLLLLAEIPCWPSDAPCRFSFGFLAEAKKAGAPCVLANAWAYGGAPPCRMDQIEYSLFKRDYVRAFDAICVQDEATRALMLKAGAADERILVTGNIKFDALQAPGSPAQARSPAMLQALLAADRPIVVAGCVMLLQEQTQVLDAFSALRVDYPNALLVLAPRHPEVAEHMQRLRNQLSERELSFSFRSSLSDEPFSASTHCLVLDTMGELRDFYAAATVAHVGLNHNVLEPLAHGKPVTVIPNWEPSYPSYPVYRSLMNDRALIEAANANALANAWEAVLGSVGGGLGTRAATRALLESRQGATALHLSRIEALLLH